MTPATVPPKAIGDYRVLDELGRGGQGVVYRCRHEPSGRTAAVKTVSVGHPALFEGIRREILVLRRLRHPGIVRILDDGVARDAPWYAMELVEGEDIAAHARRAWDPRSPGPRDLAATLTPLRRLCATLAYLHGEGIVHRDLKPRNVIVTESGHPVVVDIGLTTRHADLGGRERLEIAGGGGTAAFMAPEQVRGEPVDARADLYAIGCLVYVILTGALPFGTLAEVLDPARSHRPATATGLSLPPEIDELLSRLLAKEPSSRAGYASDVAGDLERLGARSGFPAAAPAPRPYLYRPRLAGREGLARELARHAGERLAGGTGDAIVVRGESGIGKTRLVAEVARRLASRGFQVIAGECSPADPGGTRGAGVALQPFAGVFAAAADLCRAGGAEATRALLGEEGRALTVLPALAALPGGADLPRSRRCPRRRRAGASCGRRPLSSPRSRALAGSSSPSMICSGPTS
ncbi:MAG: serine/threonine-protein kinase [Acidobacteriota bacterium]